METITLNDREINNVRAERTSSYGRYIFHADVDGEPMSSGSIADSLTFDALYGENETEEEIEDYNDAISTAARYVLQANNLI